MCKQLHLEYSERRLTFTTTVYQLLGLSLSLLSIYFLIGILIVLLCNSVHTRGGQ